MSVQMQSGNPEESYTKRLAMRNLSKLVLDATGGLLNVRVSTSVTIAVTGVTLAVAISSATGHGMYTNPPGYFMAESINRFQQSYRNKVTIS